MLNEAHLALLKAEELNPGLQGPIEGMTERHLACTSCRRTAQTTAPDITSACRTEACMLYVDLQEKPSWMLAAGVGLYAPLAAGVRRLAEWVRDEAAAAPQEQDGRGHRTILHGPQVASVVLRVIASSLPG